MINQKDSPIFTRAGNEQYFGRRASSEFLDLKRVSWHGSLLMILILKLYQSYYFDGQRTIVHPDNRPSGQSSTDNRPRTIVHGHLTRTFVHFSIFPQYIPKYLMLVLKICNLRCLMQCKGNYHKLYSWPNEYPSQSQIILSSLI